MASSHDPQSLGSALKGVIERLGIRREIDEARAIEAWAALAGPQINGVTHSAWVKGDVLYIRLRSAAWRQELHLNRRAWCDRLNAELGGDVVQEIQFR